MSKLGKTFLWLALVGALVAIGAGWFEIQKYNETKTNLTQMTAAKARSDEEAAKQKAAAEAAALKEADTETKLTAANAKADDLTTKLAATQKQADDAAAALTQVTADRDKAKADLAEIDKALNGQSPADVLAARDKAKADLAALQDEQKILQDSLQSSQKQVADLKDAINRRDNGGKMPGVSGKVTFVNRTWNFVVLDVGLASGVVPNGELIVYRNNNFLGKVRVTSVEANSAVADILPDTKGNIQVGDYVLN